HPCAAREATGRMATALLVSQAAPEPRSWVGRVRVVGAADVIDALGAWRVSGSPDFHRDSIEAGSFGIRPRTLSGAGVTPYRFRSARTNSHVPMTVNTRKNA